MRKFKVCSVKVRCFLFTTFCYLKYDATLWIRCNAITIEELKVSYNQVFRMLLDYPPRHSAKGMCVSQSVRFFDELQRHKFYNIKMRLDRSQNILLRALASSDAFAILNISDKWNFLLYIHPG